jgi:hypothetical protein
LWLRHVKKRIEAKNLNIMLDIVTAVFI